MAAGQPERRQRRVDAGLLLGRHQSLPRRHDSARRARLLGRPRPGRHHGPGRRELPRRRGVPRRSRVRRARPRRVVLRRRRGRRATLRGTHRVDAAPRQPVHRGRRAGRRPHGALSRPRWDDWRPPDSFVSEPATQLRGSSCAARPSRRACGSSPRSPRGRSATGIRPRAACRPAWARSRRCPRRARPRRRREVERDAGVVHPELLVRRARRRRKSIPWSSAMLFRYISPRDVSCCDETSSALDRRARLREGRRGRRGPSAVRPRDPAGNRRQAPARPAGGGMYGVALDAAAGAWPPPGRGRQHVALEAAGRRRGSRSAARRKLLGGRPACTPQEGTTASTSIEAGACRRHSVGVNRCDKRKRHRIGARGGRAGLRGAGRSYMRRPCQVPSARDPGHLHRGKPAGTCRIAMTPRNALCRSET